MFSVKGVRVATKQNPKVMKSLHLSVCEQRRRIEMKACVLKEKEKANSCQSDGNKADEVALAEII